MNRKAVALETCRCIPGLSALPGFAGCVTVRGSQGAAKPVASCAFRWNLQSLNGSDRTLTSCRTCLMFSFGRWKPAVRERFTKDYGGSNCEVLNIDSRIATRISVLF